MNKACLIIIWLVFIFSCSTFRSIKEPVVIADFNSDYLSYSFPGNWFYMRNNGVIGDSSHYVPLLWDAKNGKYDINGETYPDKNSNFTAVSKKEIHPGPGRLQQNIAYKIEYYVIIAYKITKEQEGSLDLINGSISGVHPQGDYGHSSGWQIALLKNDTQIVEAMNMPWKNEPQLFSFHIGNVVTGDTIYFALGPNGVDYCDAARVQFQLSLSPSNSSANISTIVIERPAHYIGKGEGNEGLAFETEFIIPTAFTRATLEFNFVPPLGPNLESLPLVSINGSLAGSLQPFFPALDPRSLCWQTNTDNSHDYNCGFHVSLNIKSLLKVGSNVFRISSGRPDDGYCFANVVVISDAVVENQKDNTKNEPQKETVRATIESDVQVKEDMVYVEGGTFQMGSDSHGYCKPVHTVTVSSFYMMECEVAQQKWKEVMGSDPSSFKGDTIPIENVSWYDALEFCNKLSEKEGFTPCYSGVQENIHCDFSANGYRLPTEAEWEYAARGGKKSKGYKFGGDDNIEEVAWYIINSGRKINQVGAMKGNELGLFDMSGNVREWCWDWFWGYDPAPATNPTGAVAGIYRVIRGGSWDLDKDRCTVWYRESLSPKSKNSSVGFRVVRAAK